MKTSKFAIGQIWESTIKGSQGTLRFTILGPALDRNPKTWKRCRLEYLEPYFAAKYPAFEADYSHAHLKRYAQWKPVGGPR